MSFQILDLTYFSPSFQPQDLFPGDPPLDIDEIHPVPQDLGTDTLVPFGDKQVVKSLVPEESPGKETPRGDTGVKRRVPVPDWGRTQVGSEN